MPAMEHDTMDGAYADDGGVGAELMQKHARSSQNESKEILAVYQAVTEVICAENMSVTPVSLFAAVMSSLEAELSSPNVRAIYGYSYFLHTAPVAIVANAVAGDPGTGGPGRWRRPCHEPALSMCAWRRRLPHQSHLAYPL